MVKLFFIKLKTAVAGGAIIIAFFSIVSRLLGLLRDRLLAHYFGAGNVTDAYWAAFRLPDLIFNSLVVGALSVAFIPVFMQYWQKNHGTGQKESWQIANTLLNLIVLGLIVLSVIGIVLAPYIVPWLTPGFQGNPDQMNLTISLTRIMLLSIVFFGASNLLSSVLNAFKRFLAFSLAPVMYNLGIIGGILVAVKYESFLVLGWGVVVGSILYLLFQLPGVR